MLPALSLANHKIEEAWREFEDAVDIESTIVPRMLDLGGPLSVQSAGALKATLIEGVYTAAEGILKEILTVVDGGVSSSGENWHMRLLAQSVQSNERRKQIISNEVFEMLNKLRAFRHIERNVYRHMLRETSVNENFETMREVFPILAKEAKDFIDTYGMESKNDFSPS